MVRMKKEEIDNIIDESALKTDSYNIWQKFLENIDNVEETLKINNAEYNDTTVIFAAAIETALCNSINMMREILYRLYCEDDDTKK